MQVEGDVDRADVTEALQVLEAGAFQLRRRRSVAHIYPAHSLLSIDEVHSHRLLGGDGGEPGRGSTQGGASDVMEVGDQQNRQTVHWL